MNITQVTVKTFYDIEITFDDDAYAYASISNEVEEVVMR